MGVQYRALVAAALILLAWAWPAQGQCEPHWSHEFAAGDLDGPVWDLAWFDDGSGPALYVAGGFTLAGGEPARRIARWDGVSWSRVGGGMDNTVRALTVYDDGSGPVLVAAGNFTEAGGAAAPSRVAMWDGVEWTPLPGSTDGHVEALGVFDDGAGASLYIGGDFTTAGGVAAESIARWDGAAWSALPGGVRGTVSSMEVFDDGAGPALYIAGDFDAAGGAPARSLAKWSGSAWRPVQLPPLERFPFEIADLMVWDDGAGPALYATGRFEEASGMGGIARLRAGAWDVLVGSPMFPGGVSFPLGLIEVDGALALGAGVFGVVGAWVDGQWRELGAAESVVQSLLYVEGASGASTYVGGRLSLIGGTGVRNIARWDGAEWSAVTGFQGVGAAVGAIESSPPQLYVGGGFVSVGGVAAARVAVYEDGAWSALGSGIPAGTSCITDAFVSALLEVSLPGASGLITGGSIGGAGGVSSLAIARWHESTWHAMGDGLPLGGCADCCPSVSALAVFDDGSGPALYAAGLFNDPAAGIARWSGAGWEDIGAALSGFPWGAGNALAAHDDGSGRALYVGGWFDSAGGLPAANIARWDGAEWSAVGAGLPGSPVAALMEFEGDLIAAGSGSGLGEVWRWDGEAWRRLGASFDRSVRALAIFDDGSGPALYAGGRFTAYNGEPIGGLARWDGSDWRRVAGGVQGAVRALEVEVDGGGTSLLVGGSFSTVGEGVSSLNIARLIGCACYADCDGDEQLTFFDFLCFQNEFAARSAYADCDDSGGHDFFDFLCFQNAFAAGCP